MIWGISANSDLIIKYGFRIIRDLEVLMAEPDHAHSRY